MASGRAVVYRDSSDIKVGNCLALKDIPGTIIHNIELKPGKGAS